MYKFFTSFTMDQIETTSKTTWKPITDLRKTEIARVYDALAQSKTKTDREASIRRMIHFPPEYETVFANLMWRVNRIFDDNDCPSANYKTKCYKEFKHILNEVQWTLTNSGESVGLLTGLLTRRSPIPTTPQSTTP